MNGGKHHRSAFSRSFRGFNVGDRRPITHRMKQPTRWDHFHKPGRSCSLRPRMENRFVDGNVARGTTRHGVVVLVLSHPEASTPPGRSLFIKTPPALKYGQAFIGLYEATGASISVVHDGSMERIKATSIVGPR